MRRSNVLKIQLFHKQLAANVAVVFECGMHYAEADADEGEKNSSFVREAWMGLNAIQGEPYTLG